VLGCDVRHFRFFLAVMPDDGLRKRIAETTRSLSLGWFIPTRPHQIHLTLRFLGQVPQEYDRAMELALTSACARHSAFSVDIEGGGLFGESAAWFGIVDDGRLAALAGDLDAELSAAGFVPRDRPFLPHITIARAGVGGLEHCDVRAIETMPHVGTLRVDEVVLVKSQMTAFGPEYEHPARARLE